MSTQNPQHQEFRHLRALSPEEDDIGHAGQIIFGSNLRQEVGPVMNELRIDPAVRKLALSDPTTLDPDIAADVREIVGRLRTAEATEDDTAWTRAFRRAEALSRKNTGAEPAPFQEKPYTLEELIPALATLGRQLPGIFGDRMREVTEEAIALPFTETDQEVDSDGLFDTFEERELPVVYGLILASLDSCAMAEERDSNMLYGKSLVTSEAKRELAVTLGLQDALEGTMQERQGFIDGVQSKVFDILSKRIDYNQFVEEQFASQIQS